jgi:hypothetical protein
MIEMIDQRATCQEIDADCEFASFLGLLNDLSSCFLRSTTERTTAILVIFLLKQARLRKPKGSLLVL